MTDIQEDYFILQACCSQQLSMGSRDISGIYELFLFPPVMGNAKLLVHSEN